MVVMMLDASGYAFRRAADLRAARARRQADLLSLLALAVVLALVLG